MVINQINLYHGTMHGKAVLRKYPFKPSDSQNSYVYTKRDDNLFQELFPH